MQPQQCSDMQFLCPNPYVKVFIISIFTQICFGRLTFLRENVNLPKKFDKNLFLNPPKTQIPVTKVFIVWHVKNKCNFCQIFFGRLTFSRKNGEIKDFTHVLFSKMVHKYERGAKNVQKTVHMVFGWSLKSFLNGKNVRGSLPNLESA